MSEAGGERIDPNMCVSGGYGRVIDLAQTDGTDALRSDRHRVERLLLSHEMVLLDLGHDQMTISLTKFLCILPTVPCRCTLVGCNRLGLVCVRNPEGRGWQT